MNMKKILQKFAVVFVLMFGAIIDILPGGAFAKGEGGTVTVFFNEACQDCGVLVKEFYPGFFEEYEYTLILEDYINKRSNRAELRKFNEEWKVPFELQSHIEAFVGNKLLIGGHVPETIMRYLIENPSEYDRLLVYQDQ